MQRLRGILVILTALLLFSFVTSAQTQDENLSAGRSLGIGMEVGFPWGGLISGRYWFDSSLGAEAIIFAWGDRYSYSGIFTGRVLYKLSDTPTVDFYVAGGASLPFSIVGTETMIFSLAGGIEFNFAFARNFAWNVEFGGTVSAVGDLTMAIGTGIHFYF